jgi:membrane protease YdiL (CAAX protease family)
VFSFYLTLVMVIFTSIFPEIVFRELAMPVPAWLPYFKIVVLLSLAVFLRRFRQQYGNLSGFAVVLSVFVALHEGSRMVLRTDGYKNLFAGSTWFVASVGSQIVLKLVVTLPMIALLLWMYGKPRSVYLVAGDLDVKAEAIPAFGIAGNWVSWRRLAVLSGLAIATGTLLLTLITVTGFSAPENLGALPGSLPFILLFALINSFSEGILFRNAVLGPLSGILPKAQLMLVAAVFFGIAHYYGAPQGVVGVLMSGVLGWYMCRSMYETGGLVAPWVIHFLQDVIIFSTLVALTIR